MMTTDQPTHMPGHKYWWNKEILSAQTRVTENYKHDDIKKKGVTKSNTYILYWFIILSDKENMCML